MKGKLENYQLISPDQEQVGIISTNAPQTIVEEIWGRLCQDELTDAEKEHLEYHNMEEEADSESNQMRQIILETSLREWRANL